MQRIVSIASQCRWLEDISVSNDFSWFGTARRNCCSIMSQEVSILEFLYIGFSCWLPWTAFIAC